MKLNRQFLNLDDDMLELDPKGPRKNINQRRFREGEIFDSGRPSRQPDTTMLMRERRNVRQCRRAERFNEWISPRMRSETHTDPRSRA